MKCFFCGEEIADNTPVCPWCGRRQSKVNQPKIGINFDGAPISYRGKRGKPLSGYIFRNLKPGSPSEQQELVSSVMFTFAAMVGQADAAAPNVGFFAHASVLEGVSTDMIERHDPEVFLGGGSHIPHFYLMQHAKAMLDGLDLGTHDLGWITFRDDLGGRGILYIFYQC